VMQRENISNIDRHLHLLVHYHCACLCACIITVHWHGYQLVLRHRLQQFTSVGMESWILLRNSTLHVLDRS
jgi:hypothetical protein